MTWCWSPLLAGNEYCAAVSVALAFHIVEYLPATIAPWLAANLKNGLIINVVLGVFNLFPLPPLDGGRILVGVLPKAMAAPVARLEPYGPRLVAVWTGAILDVILHVTGNV